MKELYLVIGPGRSGTSLVMRILAALGVYLGPKETMMPPHPQFNPQGYMEQLPIWDANRTLIDALENGSTFTDVKLDWDNWKYNGLAHDHHQGNGGHPV